MHGPRTLPATRIAKFVREFFGKIDEFRDSARHPKWSEVNIAAEMPGWTRFKPAADWLAEHRIAAAAGSRSAAHGGTELKLAFDQFVDQYVKSRGMKTISAADQDLLFAKFQQYLQAQVAVGSR